MALPLGYAKKKKTFDRKTSVCCCDWDGATVIGYADEPDAYHFLWCNTPVHTGDTRNSWRTVEIISNQFLDLLIILIVPHWLLFHCSLILSFPRTERIQNFKYTVLINDSDSITNGIYDYTNCVTDHRLMYWWREVIWLSSKVVQKKGMDSDGREKLNKFLEKKRPSWRHCIYWICSAEHGVDYVDNVGIK